MSAKSGKPVAETLKTLRNTPAPATGNNTAKVRAAHTPAQVTAAARRSRDANIQHHLSFTATSPSPPTIAPAVKATVTLPIPPGPMPPSSATLADTAGARPAAKVSSETASTVVNREPPLPLTTRQLTNGYVEICCFLYLTLTYVQKLSHKVEFDESAQNNLLNAAANLYRNCERLCGSLFTKQFTT